MAYPTDKPTGNFSLRDYDFATLDSNKLPMDEYLFKNGYKNADESEIESVPDAHNQNWLFDILHRNLRYTQQLAEENKKQLETKLATPTSIGQVKIGYGLEITSGGVLSVAKQVAEDANIISYDLPVGSYMLWAGNNAPEYFIEPSGQTLLRSSYPELWQFAQDNGLVGKLFGAGNGSTTFTVTDIRGHFISLANTNDKVGKFTQAGIPNITAQFGGSTQGTYSGAVQKGNSVGRYTGGVDWAYTAQATFDASLSSSVYGKSSTVMPANWGLKIILKALPTPPVNVVPVGTILDYSGTSAPDGYIVANGAELSRTTFSRLYQWAVSNNLMKAQSSIPTTAHCYYGTGNGSTTFTIPDLRGVFKRGANLASNRGGANLGVYQADGLPNITGSIYVSNYTQKYDSGTSGSASGAFRVTKDGGTTGSSWVSCGGTYDFNASRSNSIYGKSSYVQPKNVSVTPILKY